MIFKCDFIKDFALLWGVADLVREKYIMNTKSADIHTKKLCICAIHVINVFLSFPFSFYFIWKHIIEGFCFCTDWMTQCALMKKKLGKHHKIMCFLIHSTLNLFNRSNQSASCVNCFYFEINHFTEKNLSCAPHSRPDPPKM